MNYKSIVIAMLIFLPTMVSAQIFPEGIDLNPVSISKKIIAPNTWLKDKALKYGLASSVIVAQCCQGIVDGYHFGGNGSLCNESNYHLWANGARFGYIGIGYFVFATIQTDRMTWAQKGRRLVSMLPLALMSFNWSYKYQRYQNPWDYTPERNRNNIVLFKIEGWEIKEFSVGTGHISGTMVDLGSVWVFKTLFK